MKEEGELLSDTSLLRVLNPIHPEWYDYRSYKSKINAFITQEMKKMGAPGINQVKPRDIFWQIVEGSNVGRSDVYAYLTYHFAYSINIWILFEMKRIREDTKILEQEWFNYLNEKIIRPNILNFPKSFLKNLLFATPFTKELQVLYHEALQTNPDSFYQAHISDTFEQFWQKFQETFGKYFAIFEKFSLYIGEELAQIEKKGAPKNIRDVYQTFSGSNNPGPRAPVGYKYKIDALLEIIQHVKNAVISHKHYVYDVTNPVEIKMTDYDLRQNPTWQQTFSRGALYDLFYYILILLQGFQRVVLYQRFIQAIAMNVIESTVTITCPYCNAKNDYVTTPNKKRIKCRNCSKKMQVNG